MVLLSSVIVSAAQASGETLRCELVLSSPTSEVRNEFRAGPTSPASKEIDFASPVTQKKYHDIFEKSAGKAFLDGEQVLQGTVPLTSHPGLFMGMINPKWGLLASVPNEYQPRNARVFPMYIFNVSPNDVIVHKSHFTNRLGVSSIETGDGRMRLFVHPMDLQFAKSVLKQEPEVWPATATSSLRTVLVLNPKTQQVSMIKSSLHATEGALVGMVPKIIPPSGTEKATVLTDAVEKLHQQTSGVLPSGKTWDVMREDFGVRPAGELGRQLGGYIYRDMSELPKDNNEEVVTWYALFSKQPNGAPPIMEQLFQDSGMRSRSDFAWNEVLKPLIELESMLKWENQFSTQFHQQNTMLRIENVNGRRRVKGIVFRDVEGMSVGFTVRTRALHKAPIFLQQEAPNFASNAKIFGFAGTANDLFFSYRMKLREEGIIWAFTSWLNPIGARMMAWRADKAMLQSFNRTFPEAKARNLKAAQKYLTSLERSLETESEKVLYAPLREQNAAQKVFASWKRTQKSSSRSKGYFTVEDKEPTEK